MKYKFIAVAVFFIICISYSTFAYDLKGIDRPYYTLIISIGSYPQQPAWPTVNSKMDVDNLRFFNDKIAYGGDLKILKDEGATKKNIIAGLQYILTNCSKDDKVYLHFSGGGFLVQTDSARQIFMPYDAPSVEDVSDAVMNNIVPDLSNAITDNELIEIIQKIRRKIGPGGECFFTMDASHFGPKNSQPHSLIGRGGFLKISDKEAGLSPFIMLTSCLDKEESYFIGDKEPYTRSFSLALKIFSESLKIYPKIKYADLFAGVKKEMRLIAPSQTPSIAGFVDNQYVFSDALQDNSVSKKTYAVTVEKAGNISAQSRLFILSVGISNYKGPYALANCDDDAVLFTQVLKSSWQNDTSLIKTWLLLNTAATKQAIIKAINDIIAEAKDDDLFAFFFAGFTNEIKNTNGSFQETWFYPQTDKPISLNSREGFNESEILKLTDLKKLFDYLKCDKQLLFTEAGPSQNFKREFVRSMIKTNPVITEIRKRNRVIIVPTTFGWDALECNGHIDHGPGLYFFSQLAKEGVDIFDLFNDSETQRKNVIYQYRNVQFKCRYPDEYMSFFFEKEFVEDLQYYFTKDIAVEKNTSRGAGEKETDEKKSHTSLGKKYALVIGTDKFSTWNKLQNPVNDAISIADTLSKLFGFTTTILKNPSLKEIYNSLYAYKNILQENDQFILYLAGHGYYDSSIFKDGFIVTSDSKALRADTFLSSYIPFNQLRSITDNFKAKQILVLLDVCFSGAFDDNAETLGGNINYSLTGKLTDKSVVRKMEMTTRKYITAGSRVEEVADDYNGQHSPFAYFLLEGLRRAAKEKKYLSSGMLFKFIQSYLEDTVPLQAGFGKDQEKSGSEFIFFAK